MYSKLAIFGELCAHLKTGTVSFVFIGDGIDEVIGQDVAVGAPDSSTAIGRLRPILVVRCVVVVYFEPKVVGFGGLPG